MSTTRPSLHRNGIDWRWAFSRARVALLLMLLAFAFAPAVHATCVQGEISSNTTWSGNVCVSGDVKVLSGVTLTISAGTVISISPTSAQDLQIEAGGSIGRVDFGISGTLDVNGTSGSHVVFQSSAMTPTEEDWYQIQIGANGTLTMDYAEVRHSEYGVASISNGTVSINSCLFEENEDDDITIFGTPTLNITSSTFDVGEHTGIIISAEDGSSITIEGNYLFGDAGQIGIDVKDDTDVTLESNTIQGFTESQTGYGIWLHGFGTYTLDDNQLSDCNIGVYAVCGGPGCPSGCTLSATLRDNHIHDNSTGVKVVKTAAVDLGTLSDYGYNVIEENTIGVHNASSCGTVYAEANNWGDDCPSPNTQGTVSTTNVWCPGGGGGSCGHCPYPEGKPTLQTPRHTALLSLAPNPYNPTTTMRFAVATSANVQIVIYDARGSVVRRSELGTLRAGDHDWIWDGRNDAGEPSSSGVYLFELRIGDHVESRKGVMVR